MPENATPSDPITAAIENSIAEATDTPIEDAGGDDAVDTVVDAGANDPAVAQVVSEGTDNLTADKHAADAVDKPAAEAKKDEPKDDLEKELEALGLGKRELAPGERENRIPYSRTRKIVGNAIKRAEEKFKAQVTEHSTKAQALETELTPYRRVDQLIVQDPEKYLGMLATLHPNLYGKYVGKGAAAPEAAKPAASTVPTAAEDPEPKPDHKFEDGTLGYTPEQHSKLLQWNHRQGVREAEARLEARVKPLEAQAKALEQERLQRERDAQAQPRVEAQKDWATKTFGKLWTDEYAKGPKSEILAVMKANDGQMGRPYLSFEAAVAQVLTPKLQADRNIIRASVLDEINARPAAASKGPVAAAKPAAEDAGPKSMEQVIKESLVAAGLSK